MWPSSCTQVLTSRGTNSPGSLAPSRAVETTAAAPFELRLAVHERQHRDEQVDVGQGDDLAGARRHAFHQPAQDAGRGVLTAPRVEGVVGPRRARGGGPPAARVRAPCRRATRSSRAVVGAIRADPPQRRWPSRRMWARPRRARAEVGRRQPGPRRLRSGGSGLRRLPPLPAGGSSPSCPRPRCSRCPACRRAVRRCRRPPTARGPCPSPWW